MTLLLLDDHVLCSFVHPRFLWRTALPKDLCNCCERLWLSDSCHRLCEIPSIILREREEGDCTLNCERIQGEWFYLRRQTWDPARCVHFARVTFPVVTVSIEKLQHTFEKVSSIVVDSDMMVEPKNSTKSAEFFKLPSEIKVIYHYPTN